MLCRMLRDTGFAEIFEYSTLRLRIISFHLITHIYNFCENCIVYGMPEIITTCYAMIIVYSKSTWVKFFFFTQVEKHMQILKMFRYSATVKSNISLFI